MTQVVAHNPCWRAELTIGTKHGYSDPEIVTPADIASLVQQYQVDIDPWYAVIVWTRGTVLGPTFPPETVIKVSMESNPMYSAHTSEGELTGYATGLAAYLAQRLNQIRVYVAVYAIQSIIVDTSV